MWCWERAKHFSIANFSPFMMENWYPRAFPVGQVHSTRLFYLMRSFCCLTNLAVRGSMRLLRITIMSRIPEHKEMNGLLPSHRQILVNSSSAQFSWGFLPAKMNFYVMSYPLTCCSVTQLCLTLCDPRDCSMPGFLVLHHLQEFAQTHPLSQWCHTTISSSVVPFPSCLQSFPVSGSFLMSQLFASGGQIIGASASASVLPNEYSVLISFRTDWFDLLAV